MDDYRGDTLVGQRGSKSTGVWRHIDVRGLRDVVVEGALDDIDDGDGEVVSHSLGPEVSRDAGYLLVARVSTVGSRGLLRQVRTTPVSPVSGPGLARPAVVTAPPPTTWTKYNPRGSGSRSVVSSARWTYSSGTTSNTPDAPTDLRPKCPVYSSVTYSGF